MDRHPASRGPAEAHQREGQAYTYAWVGSSPNSRGMEVMFRSTFGRRAEFTFQAADPVNWHDVCRRFLGSLALIHRIVLPLFLIRTHQARAIISLRSPGVASGPPSPLGFGLPVTFSFWGTLLCSRLSQHVSLLFFLFFSCPPGRSIRHQRRKIIRGTSSQAAARRGAQLRQVALAVLVRGRDQTLWSKCHSGLRTSLHYFWPLLRCGLFVFFAMALSDFFVSLLLPLRSVHSISLRVAGCCPVPLSVRWPRCPRSAWRLLAA